MRLKDALIALVAAVVAAAVTYVLAITRPHLPPTPSQPFTSAAARSAPAVKGEVVLRVNGEPVTKAEFEAAWRLLPDQMQQQFGASEAGKMALAEQIIRMKLLEQEARRMGLPQDPGVAAQLDAQKTEILANAAAEKLAPQPSAADVQQFYAQNQKSFQTIDLSHILFAYAGGSVPPRKENKPPTKAEAMKQAEAVYAQLKAGADFATLARQYSDDTASAEQGGKLGNLAPGMMPPDLEAAVSAIPDGRISPPIVSQFGIHIFKVNGRSTRPLDAQLQPAIAMRVRQQKMFDRVEAMRKTASVYFDPKFFPDVKKLDAGKKKS